LRPQAPEEIEEIARKLQCETTQNREHGTGASLFGYTKLCGQVPGGQAEYLRVPTLLGLGPSSQISARIAAHRRAPARPADARPGDDRTAPRTGAGHGCGRVQLNLVAVATVEEEIDRLFGLPLDEFTAARNELVRQLKRDGDVDGAARVRALQKPTVAAWTINQLARRDGDGVRALLEAGEALRSAQTDLLRGQEAGDALREATAQEREAVRELTARAERVLADAGRPASPAMLERVAATLRAAAVGDDGRRLLETGRLTAELDPSGFGGLTGAPAGTTPRRSRSPAPSAAVRRREREEEQQRRQELRQRSRDLERAAKAAEREAEKAEAAAAEARRRAEQARAEANAAAEVS
jgi:hypothetical protein